MDLHRQAENLIYRYAEMIDEGDFDGLGSVFARASIHFVPGGLSLHGARDITSFYEKSIIIDAATGTPCTTHWVSNVMLHDVPDGLSARSRYQVTLSQNSEPPRLIATGRYFDQFFVDGDRVYFAQRRIITEYMGDTSGHLRQGLWTAANKSNYDLSRR